MGAIQAFLSKPMQSLQVDRLWVSHLPQNAAAALRGSVLGTGCHLPGQIVTNETLVSELQLNTTDGWIVEKTGIRERRRSGRDESVAEMAADAGREALLQSGISSTDLSLIVVATSTADYTMPSTAALVQRELGALRAAAFDVNAACAGFVYAMDIAVRCLQSLGGVVLVIGADRASSLADPTDRTTSIFFGDGAAAVVMGGEGPGVVLASELHTSGQLDALEVPSGGYMRMDGKAIWKFATRVLPVTLHSLCNTAGIGIEELKLIVPHQANANIIRAAAGDLGLPIDRFAMNIDRVGNTVAASVPLALDEALRAGRAQRGDFVALVGFGAGLCWGGQLLQL